MLARLVIAWLLMALCVILHALGTTLALRTFGRRIATVQARFWRSTWYLVRVAGSIILLHLLEIAAWAFFYRQSGAIADFHSSLYFSVVTYTTTGYGDVLLPDEWRLVGGVEALTGILLSGWSAAFFFSVVSRIQREPPPAEQA
jgi:voltage-gated potassium channel Kch